MPEHDHTADPCGRYNVCISLRNPHTMPFPRRLAVLFAALLALAGCAPRRAPVSGAFTFAGIDAQDFVLAPALAPDAGTHLNLPIQVAAGSGNLSACSIHQQWFSFEPASTAQPGRWSAQAPSASAWAHSGGYVDMTGEWRNFLRALDALQQKGCFASPNATGQIVEQMTAQMDLPDQDALFYRYGFGLGGYVDLTPGMQLQIDRILSTPVMDVQTHKVTNLNEMLTAYTVVRGSGSGVRLRVLRSGTYTRLDPAHHPDIAALHLPDRQLAAQFRSTPHLRLMLKTIVVADNVNRPAMLLGAATQESVDAAADQLMSGGKTSCSELASARVECAQFDGTVAVGPKLAVVVNRHTVYVTIGARLWSVLPRTPGVFKIALPPTLRVERKLGDQYVEVRAAPGVTNFSQMTLLQGDRISW